MRNYSKNWQNTKTNINKLNARKALKNITNASLAQCYKHTNT